jgi:hypothetical protein
MNTTTISEQERLPLQERLAQAVIEDRSLPAEQVLSGQNDPEDRPALFVP